MVIFGALLSWSCTKSCVCLYVLVQIQCKIGNFLSDYYIFSTLMNQCSYVMNLNSVTFLLQSTLVQGHVWAMCSAVFRPISDPTRVPRGYLGHYWLTVETVMQIWRSSHIMLLARESGILHPVAVTFFSSPDPMCPLHPPEPWLRPAFPVNRLLGEEGCPLGWTLPPQGWPGNDPRVPGTRTHWRDTPCPPPQHTANTQCNNVLKMVPSSLLTLT